MSSARPNNILTASLELIAATPIFQKAVLNLQRRWSVARAEDVPTLRSYMKLEVL